MSEPPDLGRSTKQNIPYASIAGRMTIHKVLRSLTGRWVQVLLLVSTAS
jgi:hypothetical protein